MPMSMRRAVNANIPQSEQLASADVIEQKPGYLADD